jgi:signal transduction histidine kinase
VFRKPPQARTPVPGLLLALVVILCSVVVYSWYIRIQITHLRQVQSELVDRNRRDSLQLLRIQNGLNGLALAMRDMVEGDEPYPLNAWEAQFRRTRTDLDDAFRLEEQLAAVRRTPEQRQYLQDNVAQFWGAVDNMFRLAEPGDEKQARSMIKLSLQARQEALSSTVARSLVENNQTEEQAAREIEQIYSRVERQVYLFLAATLSAIIVTGVLLIRSNRIMFQKLAELSEQRSDLAHKLIATQESTLQFISRELHDEFGQILTAIGSLLGRAEKQSPEGAPWTKNLREVRDITQSTLDSVRSLSQALHPMILEEAGVEAALDWYLPTVERQNGIRIKYEKSGESRPISTSAGIHIYRIVQEAVNNVVRHSGAHLACVRLGFRKQSLLVEVQDDGSGMPAERTKRGIGLVAMRERAQLLEGNIEWLAGPGGGTIVRLEIPQERLN